MNIIILPFEYYLIPLTVAPWQIAPRELNGSSLTAPMNHHELYQSSSSSSSSASSSASPSASSSSSSSSAIYGHHQDQVSILMIVIVAREIRFIILETHGGQLWTNVNFVSGGFTRRLKVTLKWLNVILEGENVKLVCFCTLSLCFIIIILTLNLIADNYHKDSHMIMFGLVTVDSWSHDHAIFMLSFNITFSFPEYLSTFCASDKYQVILFVDVQFKRFEARRCLDLFTCWREGLCCLAASA